MMRRSILYLFITITIVGIGCGRTSNDGSDQSQDSDAEGAALVEECFTRLHPSLAIDGIIPQVVFQHGRCVGEYEALNKFTVVDTVAVSSVGTADTSNAPNSKLYLDGTSVYVKTDQGIDVIGTYIERGEVVALELKKGVEFALEVTQADGSVSLWQYQSDTEDDEVQQKERIVLFLPS